jgi:hypothetical protein
MSSPLATRRVALFSHAWRAVPARHLTRIAPLSAVPQACAKLITLARCDAGQENASPTSGAHTGWGTFFRACVWRRVPPP